MVSNIPMLMVLRFVLGVVEAAVMPSMLMYIIPREYCLRPNSCPPRLQVPVAALDSDAVKAGVRAIKDRRPLHFKARQEADKSLKLPGF